MLQQLSWPSLQIRRKILRLQLLHKIFYHQTSLSIPTYYMPIARDNTRHYHPKQFILPPVSTTSHLQSFFSRTFKEWNNLPRSMGFFPGHIPAVLNAQYKLRGGRLRELEPPLLF